jgi:uncharacterized protein YkwD
MSKAGLTLALAFLLLVSSGVINKTYAKEKLNLLTVDNVSENSNICKTDAVSCSVCGTALQNVFLTSTCDENSAQVDSSLKASAQNQDSSVNEFSYATEPTEYIPPTPTPTTVVTTNTTASSVVSPAPSLDQAPMDNLPAAGQNLNSDVIFDMINEHRAQIGKSAFIKDQSLCSLAQIRSTELYGELFEGKGALHSGLYNRNLPYWVTENAKYGSNEAGTVRWWLNSPIHRAAIEGNDIYSCGACNGTVCSQLFTSYTPKGGGTPQVTPVPTN